MPSECTPKRGVPLLRSVVYVQPLLLQPLGQPQPVPQRAVMAQAALVQPLPPLEQRLPVSAHHVLALSRHALALGNVRKSVLNVASVCPLLRLLRCALGVPSLRCAAHDGWRWEHRLVCFLSLVCFDRSGACTHCCADRSIRRSRHKEGCPSQAGMHLGPLLIH